MVALKSLTKRWARGILPLHDKMSVGMYLDSLMLYRLFYSPIFDAPREILCLCERLWAVIYTVPFFASYESSAQAMGHASCPNYKIEPIVIGAIRDFITRNFRNS